MDSGSYYSAKRLEPDAQDTLIMEQAEFAWQSADENFRLTDLNVIIPKGQFVGVIGRVGSGKSSFLQAITGNLIKKSGSIYVRNWQEGRHNFNDQLLFKFEVINCLKSIQEWRL